MHVPEREVTARQLLATYRVQMHKDFTLKQARDIVPYLKRLGISHLYSSPQLRARSGSTHGYDVVDPTVLNPELGTDADRRALVDALHAEGLGLVLDIVPNHMGVGPENPYWQNVLMHGQSSAYSDWFDIDWGSPRAAARGRVLLPVLGKELDAAIGDDELGVTLDTGCFRVAYFDKWFPLDPATVSDILNFDIAEVRDALGEDDPDLREYDEIVDGFSSMPPRWSTEEGSRDERRRRSEATGRRLTALLERSTVLREHVRRATEHFAKGVEGRRRLRTLLDMQAYELAFWQHAAKRINYRRFFDISDLAGLRAEDPQVFADTHRVILEWIADGSLDGVRVDHIDGLLDPLEYLERLEAALSKASAGMDGGRPIFVEKILSPGEQLRDSWPVQGTTGYEFLNDLAAVFVSPEGSRALDEAFREQLKLTDRHMDFASVAHEGKLRVLAGPLLPDIKRVARFLKPLTRDMDEQRGMLGRLEKALAAVIAALPVYRTYIDPRTETPHADDVAMLTRAFADVRARNEVSAPVVDRLEQLFLAGRNADPERRMAFIGRFQQLSGPATAKGVEDTALYRYIPLASLNEVGSAPDRDLTTAIEDLHRVNAHRAERWPKNLLCTNTHDTKRSADVRARLHVLAEIPEEWQKAVAKWRRVHTPLRTKLGRRTAPDAVTEYLLYQTLAGVWPMSAGAADPSPADIAAVRERVEAYMIKASREAKSRTSWTEPDEEFEKALKSFLSAILEPSSSFVRELSVTVSEIARPGLWNALSRVLVHFTAPGTPDLYQGDELWNFSLVDPDNRRPVDYEERERMLSALDTQFGDAEGARAKGVQELLMHAEDARIKLYVTQRLLHARRNHPQVFSGTYAPVVAQGAHASHVVAYTRTGGAESAVVLATRLPRTLTGGAEPPIGTVWGDTTVVLPAGQWTCELSGRATTSSGQPQPLRELLGSLPVALFISAQKGK